MNVIEVKDISKKYELGTINSGSLKADVRRFFNRISGAHSQSEHGTSEKEYWALKNISFEVKQGEVLGVVGKNGAGKSTLLKILSRITSPTNGEIGVKGRIAS